MTGKQMRSQAEMLIAAADRMEEYLKRNPAAIAWDGEGQED
jgi:hypothetical protein